MNSKHSYSDITNKLRMDFQSMDKDTLVQLLIDRELRLEQQRGKTEFYKLKSDNIQEKYDFQIAYAKEGDKEWKQTSQELEDTKQRLEEVEGLWKDCQKYQDFHKKLLECYGKPVGDWDFEKLEVAMKEREQIYKRYHSGDVWVCQEYHDEEIEKLESELGELKEKYNQLREKWGDQSTLHAGELDEVNNRWAEDKEADRIQLEGMKEKIKRLEHTNKTITEENDKYWTETLDARLDETSGEYEVKIEKLEEQIGNIKVWIQKMFIQNKSEWFVEDLANNGFICKDEYNKTGGMVFRFDNKDIGKDWKIYDQMDGELEVMWEDPTIVDKNGNVVIKETGEVIG